MSKRKDLDISEYRKDGMVSLENLHIADCRIAELQSEWAKKSLVMKKCSFENVIFENHCGRGFVEISDCEYTNCAFHDTLGNGKLNVEQSRFANCTFEGINLNGIGEFSGISHSRFLNCNFKNIELKWKIDLFELELKGGKIEHFCLAGQQHITRNHIFDMQIEDLQMWGKFFNQNRMENVICKDTVLTRNKGETGSKEENIFINCDTKGLTLMEGTLGFESL